MKKLNSTLSPQKAVLILVAVGAVLLVLSFHEYLFAKTRLKFKIEKNDAAVSCTYKPRPKSLRFFFERHRSHVPEISKKSYSRQSYCGFIFTNRGNYTLPQNYEIFGFYQKRKYLAENLKVGCWYDVDVVGYGDIPNWNTPQINLRPNRKIIRIYREFDCDE